MISNDVKTRSATQVQMKVSTMLAQIASNPKHRHAKHAKVLKTLPIIVSQTWTDEQKKRFNKALRKHGKDWKKI